MVVKRVSTGEDARAPTTRSEELYPRIRNLSPSIIRNPHCLALHVLHQPIQIIAGIGDADHADGGAVPESAGIQFSCGYIEMRAQSVFQAANYLPFVFEGLGVLDAEFEGEEGNHSALGSRFLALRFVSQD